MLDHINNTKLIKYDKNRDLNINLNIKFSKFIANEPYNLLKEKAEVDAIIDKIKDFTRKTIKAK